MDDKLNCYAVICGLHRSGTTYMGRILAHSKKTEIIHEPFNFFTGLEGVPLWYPYTESMNVKKKMKFPLQNLMCIKGNWKRYKGNKKGMKAFVYQIVGGRLHFTWLFMKLKKLFGVLPDKIIWKDPFCTFMVKDLSKNRGIPVVCIVKHPCAFIYSVLKQNWFFNIDNIYKQKGLVDEFGLDIPEHYWKQAKSNNIVALAILWKLMARVVSEAANENEKLLVIAHEHFCLRPDDSMLSICQLIGIEYSQRMQAYVTQTTKGDAIEAPRGETKFFKRNSKQLMNAWRGKISLSDEALIKEIVGEDMHFWESLVNE